MSESITTQRWKVNKSFCNYIMMDSLYLGITHMINAQAYSQKVAVILQILNPSYMGLQLIHSKLIDKRIFWPLLMMIKKRKMRVISMAGSV